MNDKIIKPVITFIDKEKQSFFILKTIAKNFIKNKTIQKQDQIILKTLIIYYAKILLYLIIFIIIPGSSIIIPVVINLIKKK